MMRITDLLYENDWDHQDALDETGYWGRQGAGCIFFAKDTRKFCIFHRSMEVLEPHTWGGVGGAIDDGENPEQAVRREIKEEAHYTGQLQLVKFYVFKDQKFKYTNFVGVVPNEFTPNLNWENQGFQWVEFGQWPRPLHPGFAQALADRNADRILRRIAGL